MHGHIRRVLKESGKDGGEVGGEDGGEAGGEGGSEDGGEEDGGPRHAFACATLRKCALGVGGRLRWLPKCSKPIGA